MDHHTGDLPIARGWNWMISCWGWRGVTGGCAPKPEGESLGSIHSLTAAIHLLSPFPPLWSGNISQHHHLFMARYEDVFQSQQTFGKFQYMHSPALICKHDLIKMQSYVPCELRKVLHLKWHWCCTSRHYVYLCVYFFLVITRRVCSCKASEIWSVVLAHIRLREINFWL